MRKRLLSVLLALCMLLSLCPMAAFAAEGEEADLPPKEMLIDAKELTLEDEEWDNDLLFYIYATDLFYPGFAADQFSTGDEMAYTKLSETEKAVYDKVYGGIKDILDADKADATSTEFSLGGLTQLGTSDSIGDIFTALRCDHPYEMFWAGLSYGTTGGSLTGDKYGNDVKFFIAVSKDYSSDGSATSRAVNKEKVTAAATALTNANKIIAGAADKSDYEKLVYFRDEICKLTEYNTLAAGWDKSEYGDPWQMIYVFDGKTDTTVVCEGYSKAFQYLCDQAFPVTGDDGKTADVQCYTVTGTMGSQGGTTNGVGGHMWNIVRIEDKYYLVDVTNYDGNTAYGANLFLGAVTNEHNGYKFKFTVTNQDNTTSEETKDPNFSVAVGSMTLHYLYDDDLLWDTATLKMETTAYTPSTTPGATKLTDEMVTLSGVDNLTYNGSAQEPTVTVTVGGTTLAKGTDYTVAYSKNTNAATDASVTVTGIGNYEGTVTKTFTIKPVDLTITAATVAPKTVGDADKTATVTGVTFNGLVNNEQLTLATDYSATGEYSSTDTKGEQNVTVTVMLKPTPKANNYTISSSTFAAKGTVNTAGTHDLTPPANQTMTYGEKKTVTATSTTSTALTYSADTSGVVEVNASSGEITAKKVGTATITVTAAASGAYEEATATFTVTVNAKPLTADMVTLDKTSLTYTGAEQTVTVTVADTAATITAADYTVAGNTGTNIGDYKVTVTGTGNYSGMIEKSFKIIAADISSATVEAIADQPYTGSEIKPTVTVKNGSTTLTADTDYTVAYKNNTNAGTATITITGKGGYTGTVTKNFTITAKALTVAMLSVPAQVEYTGSAPRPEVTVTDSSKTLTLGVDYTVAYSSGIAVGVTAYVEVTGIGNYTGKISKNFSIEQASYTETKTVDATLKITENAVTAVDLSALVPKDAGGTKTTYTVNEDKSNHPHATAVPGDDGKLTLTYKKGTDNSDATTDTTDETVMIIVGGMGNYKDFPVSVNIKYIGSDVDVADITITLPTGLTYDGTAKKATAAATVGGEVYDGEVTITYQKAGGTATTEAPKDAGTYTVTASIPAETENVTGTATASFTIAKAALTFTAVNKSVSVGATAPATPTVETDYTVTGLVEGDAVAPTGIVYSSTAAATTDGTITLTGPTSTENYTITYQSGKLTVTAVTVESVSLNKNTLSLTVGDEETLTATVTPDNANDKDVIWNTSDASVATVDTNGKVTAVGAGTANITAAAGGKTATCAVTVTAAASETVAVTGVTLNKTSTSLTVGSSETLTATVAPENATNKNVSWTSSNTDVATVGASGKVTAVATGEATITVTTEDGGKTAECAVTVTAATTPDPGPDTPHEHTYTTTWTSDASGHWHVCSGCTERGSFAAHTPGDWIVDTAATSTTEGSRHKECTVCGYHTETESIPATGGGSSSGGSSSGGTSSGGGNTTTETTKNPDGSTTTKTENKTTGTVTETTKNPDGSTTKVETKKDGTVTTTETDATGNKTETVAKPDGSSVTKVEQKDGTQATVNTDTEGKVEAEVTLPEQVVAAAQENEQPVMLPIPVVQAAASTEAAPVVTVKTGSDEPVKVLIPTTEAKPGTVAVIVNEDGTEEIVKTSVSTGDGLAVSLPDGATVKIVDNSKTFADVPASNWAADAVSFSSARELFSGTSESTFSPDEPMTRAMMVTVLARFDGADTSGGSTWYEQGVEWAVAKGISDGSNPGSNISREQLAVMLWRYAGSPAPTGDLEGFHDAGAVSGYAQEAMRWAVENGIINGNGSGGLMPQGEATRAQVAQMLKNFISMQ